MTVGQVGRQGQCAIDGRAGRLQAAVAIGVAASDNPRAVSAASLNFNDLDRCYGRVTTIPMPPPFNASGTLANRVCPIERRNSMA